MSCSGCALGNFGSSALCKALPSSLTIDLILRRALVGTLTWVQLRRWQTRPAATAGDAAGSAATKSEAASEPVDVQIAGHGIEDAAEEEAQQG